MYPSIRDWTGSDLILAIDRHMSSAFSTALCFVPGADWHEGGGYSALVTGIPHPLGNVFWNANIGDESAERQIHSILARVEKQDLPAAWIVGPASRPADLGERLKGNGFFLESSMPGMAIDLEALQEPALPPDTVLTEVTSSDEMLEWMQVLSSGYEVPYSVAECFAYWPAHLGFSTQSPLRAFVARCNGKPVGCSLLLLSEGLAGIYCVATTPEARRTGIGTLVTAAPLLTARKMGYRIGVLQASAMGYPIYCRMGFEEFGKIEMYVRLPRAENE